MNARLYRKIMVLLLFLTVSSSVFSASLRVFDMDHPVYDDMDALYLVEGKAVPLGIRPWSEIDVKHLLEWIEINTEEGRAIADRIRSYLLDETKDFNWKFSINLTPSMYAHSNSDFDKAEDVFYDEDILNRSLLDVSLEMTYKEYVAAFMDFSLGLNFADVTNGSKLNEYDMRYNKFFGMNIPFISEGGISLNFPDRTYLAAGFDAFRVVLARDRLSWGNGVMGNMMLGDTLPYHDYLSLTFTGNRNFSYQMLISFFTHSANEGKGDRDPLEGIRFFLGHRFEFSFWEGKITAAINESIMYQAKNGYLDPRVLNPLMFLHDLYIAGNANSLLTVELEYAPVRNFSIYAQAAIDDLAVGEARPGEVGASSDGWGVMAGLRFTVPMEKGNYMFGNFEFVYTSPFIYHRALDGESDDLYYVSSIRYIANSKVNFISRYLSFRFGSDAIATLFRFGYEDIDLFRIEGNAFFMVHGIINMFSKTDYYSEDSGSPENTPSGQNPFYKTESGVPEYTFAIGADGEIDITSYLSLDTSCYLVSVWNKDNDARPVELDVQFSLGLRLYY